MWNAKMDEAKAGIKIAGRNVNNLRYADDTSLMAESEKKLEPHNAGQRGEWKNWLETCIISYMKWVASPGSMHDTGCLGLVH